MRVAAGCVAVCKDVIPKKELFRNMQSLTEMPALVTQRAGKKFQLRWCAWVRIYVSLAVSI
jgi:hypothetical protein